MAKKKSAHKDDTKGELLPPDNAAALPGGDEENKGLLEEAVKQINQIYIAGGLSTYCALGEYLLEAFFGNDEAAYHQRSGKHASFRALAARPDLVVSHATLRDAVAVSIQVKQLPDELVESLPVSHHKLLLSLRDKKTKARLAQRAVKGALSKRDFADLVQQERRKKGEKSKGGRPAYPVAYKAFRSIEKSIDQVLSSELLEEEIARVPAKEARELLQHLEDNLDALRSSIGSFRDKMID